MYLKLTYPTANIEPGNQTCIGFIDYALRQMF